MNIRITLLMIISLLTSCKVDLQTLILRASPKTASEIIQEKLGNGDIIFIGDNHTRINPVNFLANNLESFYNAGLRYLFLEGDDTFLPLDEDMFILFYPWQYQAAWKYERKSLKQAIAAVNESAPSSEQINIVYAEAGLREAYNTGKALNDRDVFAAQKMTNIIDHLSYNEGVLIFYGSGHGSLKKWKKMSNGKDWVPFGMHLHEYYGDRFYSIDYDSLNRLFPNERLPNYFDNNRKEFFFESTYCKGTPYAWISNKYNGLILDENEQFGTPYQYVLSSININYLIKNIENINTNFDTVLIGDHGLVFEEINQYFMSIYYLKLYFPDYFKYSYWQDKDDVRFLRDDYSSFKAIFYENKDMILDNAMKKFAECNIPDYFSYIQKSNIEEYLQKNKASNYQLYTIRKAQEINPYDLWPQFWEGHMLTSMKKYAEALTCWQKILENEAIRCFEAFPEVLRMASICSEKTNNSELKEYYNNILVSLTNEHHFPDRKIYLSLF